MKEAATVFTARYCVCWNTGEYVQSQTELFHTRGEAEKWEKSFRARNPQAFSELLRWDSESQKPRD